MSEQPITIFACGEQLRGDDGAAAIATAVLPPCARGLAEVRRVHALEVEHLLELPPDQRVIVVDAVTGVPAGMLVCLELTELSQNVAVTRPHSSHQFPLDHMIRMAYLLGRPVHGTFLGIGGKDFELGDPLSEPVRHALPALRAAIAEEVERLAAEGRARPRVPHAQVTAP
jgi:hydrogenase maturation protease